MEQFNSLKTTLRRLWLWSAAVVGLVVIVGTAAWFWLTANAQSTSSTPPSDTYLETLSVWGQVPDFTLVERSGRTVQLSDLRGKVADFVGYNARTNQWLIAESKGGNLGDAFDQLMNTTKSLLTKYPDAQLELRIYVNAEKYEVLRRGGDFGGYAMNTQRLLGWVNELKQWVDAEIAGVKILVLQAP